MVNLTMSLEDTRNETEVQSGDSTDFFDFKL